MRRPGVSLVEMLVTLALTGIVTGALLQSLGGFQRLLALQPARLAANDAARIAYVVLRAELQPLVPETDVAGWSPDSLRIRAFRGMAVVCAQEPGRVVVRYRGIRNPDTAKDSVLVLDALGERSMALASSATGSGCTTQPQDTLLRWNGIDAPPGTVILLYENGAYSPGSNALRYRRGRGGRQPLTDEVLDAAASFVHTAADGGPPFLAADLSALALDPFLASAPLVARASLLRPRLVIPNAAR